MHQPRTVREKVAAWAILLAFVASAGFGSSNRCACCAVLAPVDATQAALLAQTAIPSCCLSEAVTPARSSHPSCCHTPQSQSDGDGESNSSDASQNGFAADCACATSSAEILYLPATANPNEQTTSAIDNVTAWHLPNLDVASAVSTLPVNTSPQPILNAHQKCAVESSWQK